MDTAQRGQSVQIAALNGDFASVKASVESNPSLVNSKDEDLRTPLHWACVSGDLKIFRFLMSLDVDEVPTAAEIAKLDQDGAVGSYKLDVNAQDEGGWTPLMIAISAGYEEIYHTLLAIPATNISLLNRGGQSILHFACSKSRISAVESILKLEGGRTLVRVKDRQGQLPLHRAAAIGSTIIARMLLSAGSSLSQSDAGGWTALHHACSEGHGEVAVLLIEEGIDVDKPDHDSETALQLCPADGKCETYIRMRCLNST